MAIAIILIKGLVMMIMTMTLMMMMMMMGGRGMILRTRNVCHSMEVKRALSASSRKGERTRASRDAFSPSPSLVANAANEQSC